MEWPGSIKWTENRNKHGYERWGLLFLCEPQLYSQVGLRGAASPPYKGTQFWGPRCPGPWAAAQGPFLDLLGLRRLCCPAYLG
jgi:hypothetical protein